MKIPQSMICECKRCGHEWVKRIAGRPSHCPKCKQHNWDVEAGKLKMGRPVKKG
jgi:predicted Zn-ribbon and HTH transcriptional regulator